MSTKLDNGWMVEEVPEIPAKGHRGTSLAVRKILDQAIKDPGTYLVYRARSAGEASGRYSTLKNNITKLRLGKAITPSTRKLSENEYGVYLDSTEGERL